MSYQEIGSEISQSLRTDSESSLLLLLSSLLWLQDYWGVGVQQSGSACIPFGHLVCDMLVTHA